ncbi:MAG: VWA domain-containing protein [Pseudomonadota bacterium]
MTRALFGWLALLGCLCLSGAAFAERRVAIVVDTSGSMAGNDRPRYTVLASQIVADLLQDTDAISVMRLPQGESSSCGDGPNDGLRVARQPGKTVAFQRAVDGLLTYSGGNHFCAPVRTALRDLGTDPAHDRMLLFLADADGFAGCKDPLTKELNAFRKTGGVVAAINLRAGGGEFQGDPPFSYWGYASAPDELLFRVAEVYQKFLGSSRVQTGPVRGRVEVSVDPFVREAWLVVAAEGEVGELVPDPGNPGAKRVDRSHASGKVAGDDSVTRSYRIAHLEAPQEGRWVFTASGLGSDAGFMLLQDYALAVRIPGRTRVPQKTDVPLEVEIINELTGQPITDLSRLPGLEVTAEHDGHTVVFRDDGVGGDKTRGDGKLTGVVRFDNPGEVKLPVRVRSSFYDHVSQLVAEVVERPWVLDPQLPARAVIGQPLPLKVRLRPGTPGLPKMTPPAAVQVTGATRTELRDDGTNGDTTAGDNVYSGTWTPSAQGPAAFTFGVPADGSIDPAEGSVEIVGELRFGPAKPVELGTLGSGDDATGTLDLTGATVRGTVIVTVETTFNPAGADLQVQLPSGWRSPRREDVELQLGERGPWTFPVRVEVGGCPEELDSGDNPLLVLHATGPDGRPMSLEVPLHVVVLPDPWLVCFWWIPASIAAAIVLALLIYGYIWPYAFNRQLRIWISAEEDMGEGFPHAVRQVSGTGKGFYRHARVFVCDSHRLSGRPRGAFARIEARPRGAVIQPWGGQHLYRQNADGGWDALPDHESNVYVGTVYRNELATVFFEVRRS